MTTAHGLRGGRLAPWDDAYAGVRGWIAATPSRPLAVAVAGMSGGTVHSGGKGEWIARIPRPVIAVVAESADDRALWCRIGSEADSGNFRVAFGPATAGAVLQCPVSALPAPGRLSVREVLMTTQMGRTLRALIPVLTMS